MIDQERIDEIREQKDQWVSDFQARNLVLSTDPYWVMVNYSCLLSVIDELQAENKRLKAEPHWEPCL